MSRQQDAVLGAPAPVEIPTPTGGTRTFLVNKPTAKDLATVRKWVLSQPVPEQAGGLSSAELAELGPEDRAVVLREFARSKARRELTEQDVARLMYSPAGVALTLWLAARRNHPGLTREEVAALVTPETVDEVSARLDEATSDEGTDDPKAPAGSS